VPLQTFFYPQLRWPGGEINFDEAYRVSCAAEEAIGSRNLAASGLQETLVDRIEVTVTIVLWPLTTARLTEIRTWWRTWALYGNPSNLILDRLNTCAGQYEYDAYNDYFTRAILVDNPFRPQRQEAAVTRPKYSLALTFRQDGAGGIY